MALEKAQKKIEVKKQNGGKRGVAMTKDELNERVQAMIARHVVQLSEHLSSVQIVCTKLEPNGTTTFFKFGSGDLFARAKACETFLSGVQG